MEKFTFIVSCADKRACKKVSKDMYDDGFRNFKRIENSLQGDHSMTKKFSSLDEAGHAAEELFNKHKDKVYQIAVN